MVTTGAYGLLVEHGIHICQAELMFVHRKSCAFIVYVSKQRNPFKGEYNFCCLTAQRVPSVILISASAYPHVDWEEVRSLRVRALWVGKVAALGVSDAIKAFRAD